MPWSTSRRDRASLSAPSLTQQLRHQLGPNSNGHSTISPTRPVSRPVLERSAVGGILSQSEEQSLHGGRQVWHRSRRQQMACSSRRTSGHGVRVVRKTLWRNACRAAGAGDANRWDGRVGPDVTARLGCGYGAASGGGTSSRSPWSGGGVICRWWPFGGGFLVTFEAFSSNPGDTHGGLA